jgi:hypothetical protein
VHKIDMESDESEYHVTIFSRQMRTKKKRRTLQMAFVMSASRTGEYSRSKMHLPLRRRGAGLGKLRLLSEQDSARGSHLPGRTLEECSGL